MSKVICYRKNNFKRTCSLALRNWFSSTDRFNTWLDDFRHTGRTKIPRSRNSQIVKKDTDWWMTRVEQSENVTDS